MEEAAMEKGKDEAVEKKPDKPDVTNAVSSVSGPKLKPGRENLNRKVEEWRKVRHERLAARLNLKQTSNPGDTLKFSHSILGVTDVKSQPMKPLTNQPIIGNIVHQSGASCVPRPVNHAGLTGNIAKSVNNQTGVTGNAAKPVSQSGLFGTFTKRAKNQPGVIEIVTKPVIQQEVTGDICKLANNQPEVTGDIAEPVIELGLAGNVSEPVNNQSRPDNIAKLMNNQSEVKPENTHNSPEEKVQGGTKHSPGQTQQKAAQNGNNKASTTNTGKGGERESNVFDRLFKNTPRNPRPAKEKPEPVKIEPPRTISKSITMKKPIETAQGEKKEVETRPKWKQAIVPQWGKGRTLLKRKPTKSNEKKATEEGQGKPTATNAWKIEEETVVEAGVVSEKGESKDAGMIDVENPEMEVEVTGKPISTIAENIPNDEAAMEKNDTVDERNQNEGENIKDEAAKVGFCFGNTALEVNFNENMDVSENIENPAPNVHFIENVNPTQNFTDADIEIAVPNVNFNENMNPTQNFTDADIEIAVPNVNFNKTVDPTQSFTDVDIENAVPNVNFNENMNPTQNFTDADIEIAVPNVNFNKTVDPTQSFTDADIENAVPNVNFNENMNPTQNFTDDVENAGRKVNFKENPVEINIEMCEAGPSKPPKERKSIRRSISMIHKTKVGRKADAIHRVKSENVLNVLQELDVEEMYGGEMEEEPQREEPRRRRSKSVSFMTPKYKTTTNNSLRESLVNWLANHGSSIDEYENLKCFGIQQSVRRVPTTPLPRRVDLNATGSPDNSVYATAPGTPVEDSDKENSTPQTAIQRADLEAATGWLNDLHRLIVDEQYPPDKADEWLSAIRRLCSSCSHLPIYWECLAAVEEMRGDVKAAIEYYERAIIKGAEVDSVGDSLAQLFDRFVKVDSKPKNVKMLKDVDPTNIFTSRIIKFALQQKAVKSVSSELGIEAKRLHYIATPVRRSARLSSTPARTCLVKSLQNLDSELKQNMTFQPNNSLLTND